MSDTNNTSERPKFVPYVSSESSMAEFTIGALFLGLIMSVVLGAANAYLGLRAGMTIAATYPAAVIGMAILRIFKGSILEENFARTVGSIGESIAAGAIFTIPAFIIAGVWTDLRYWEATAIMMVGGIVGILFVTVLRRVMVEDAELPFPESVAAAEIHKAGRAGGSGANFLFAAMGLGALIQALNKMKLFANTWEHFVPFTKSLIPFKAKGATVASAQGAGGALLTTPGVSPAYIGVGYIIGPQLAALNFSGGLLAWGLFVPLLLYFLAPSLEQNFIQTAALASGAVHHLVYFLAPSLEPNFIITKPPGATIDWVEMSTLVWKFVVRPIAIGGMLVSAAYTLYRMRKNLVNGLKRSISDVKKAATAGEETTRTEKDLSLRFVFPAIIVSGVLTFFIYHYFSQNVLAALVATIVMLVAGFFFAAVSGYLVGMIGSSNNPISGLTISALIVAAILMVVLGMKGQQGVAAVLGVAGVVCVSAAVAGEMLQDLKVGHVLGGTPWRMQVGDIIGVVISSAVMFWPLLVLHQGDINSGGTGFGGKDLPAPQAGLMALLSQGIVGGDMAWPLIIAGMLMAGAFILTQVKSPMLVCVGMYLPFETTAAIFIGGLIKGIVNIVSDRLKHNEAQKTRTENNGVLLASGLIAGEALIGLVFATMAFLKKDVYAIFQNPSFITSIFVFILIGAVLVYFPVKNAGRPDEPPPPAVSM